MDEPFNPTIVEFRSLPATNANTGREAKVDSTTSAGHVLGPMTHGSAMNSKRIGEDWFQSVVKSARVIPEHPITYVSGNLRKTLDYAMTT